jgi:hypothetical protein
MPGKTFIPIATVCLIFHQIAAAASESHPLGWLSCWHWLIKAGGDGGWSLKPDSIPDQERGERSGAVNVHLSLSRRGQGWWASASGLLPVIRALHASPVPLPDGAPHPAGRNQRAPVPALNASGPLVPSRWAQVCSRAFAGLSAGLPQPRFASARLRVLWFWTARQRGEPRSQAGLQPGDASRRCCRFPKSPRGDEPTQPEG